MDDTGECRGLRWDVVEGGISSDGHGRRLILETDPLTGFPDEAVGDTDMVCRMTIQPKIAQVGLVVLERASQMT